ncbi:protein SRG1-like [Coffea eugenioides]|uniref:protein SRG1-like n=1 Tax=Coffea eugenioides TaxID=49369 RepID=UPI000F60BD4C|nr:protein SRG1-like [Coffea eugenioides]
MVKEWDMLEEVSSWNPRLEKLKILFGNLTLKSPLLERIKEAQKTDPTIQKNVEKVQKGETLDFKLGSEGVLRFRDRIAVPADERLRREILEESHRSRESLQEYSIELKSLALKILNLIAKALGMKHEEIEVLLEEGLQSMRLTYYPPCPQPELVTGLCHHSDPVSLTILLQINDVQGLQIKENEAWVPVLPLPNAFIVNVGDILEISQL